MHGNGCLPMIGNHQTKSGMTIHERIKKSREEHNRTTVQFFNGSKLKYERGSLSNKDQKMILDYCNSNLILAFAHCPYVINLAKDPLDEPKSLLALHDDIEALGPAGISSVCHIGHAMGKYTIQSVCRTLSTIEFNGEGTPLLLENAAGDGSELGSSWEELTQLAQDTDPHIGFCMDTQHAFAAMDIDLQTIDGVNEFLKKIERSIGLNRLKLFHLNDSRYDPKNPTESRKFCSKKDAHANIARGYIWGEKEHLPGIKHLLLRGGELGIPFITETPGWKDEKGKSIGNRDPELIYDFLRRDTK